MGLKSFDVAVSPSLPPPKIHFLQYSICDTIYGFFFLKTYVCWNMVAFIVDGVEELASRSITLEGQVSAVGL